MNDESPNQAPDSPKQKTRSKYVGTWCGLQFLLNAKWLIAEAAATIHGHSISLPEGTQAIISSVGAVFSGFAIRVWKEIEDDAIKGAARVVRAMPGAAWDVIVRALGLIKLIALSWWPGYTRRYLAEMNQLFGLFNDRGLGLVNANRLDLEKVYVELRTAANPGEKSLHYAPSAAPAPKDDSVWSRIKRLPKGMSLVIIGAPGSGKTTLLQHILLTFASRRHNRFRLRARTPIFIEIRRLAELLLVDSNPPLVNALEHLIRDDKRYVDIAAMLPRGWLKRKLFFGDCILLWDGLDEVGDLETRKAASSWLDDTMNKRSNRRNISIVSARPGGYWAAPLERSQVLVVQPFSRDERDRFIHQWYYANEIISRGDRNNKYVKRAAEQEAEELLQKLQGNESLAGLTTNPLLLTMLCMVHRYHGALPGSRGQLYAEICQVLLERWRQRRGIEDRYTAAQKLEVLRPIAAWMMAESTREISAEQFSCIASESLARIGANHAGERASDFLHRLQEDSGLILEREIGLWTFAHLSFQEFLCADHWIMSQSQTYVDVDRMVNETWWRETLLLFASRTSDASRVVEAAIQSKSEIAATLAFSLYEERLSLKPDIRNRLEQFMFAALGRNAALFERAAGAWLSRQQSRNYNRYDATVQVSGWITNVEYQLFLVDQATEAVIYTPLHWTGAWHEGDPMEPIQGIDPQSADAYCEWMNRRFPAWRHRLPSEDELFRSSLNHSDHLRAWCRGPELKLGPGTKAPKKSPIVIRLEMARIYDERFVDDKAWLLAGILCAALSGTGCYIIFSIDPIIGGIIFVCGILFPLLISGIAGAVGRFIVNVISRRNRVRRRVQEALFPLLSDGNLANMRKHVGELVSLILDRVSRRTSIADIISVYRLHELGGEPIRFGSAFGGILADHPVSYSGLSSELAANVDALNVSLRTLSIIHREAVEPCAARCIIFSFLRDTFANPLCNGLFDVIGRDVSLIGELLEEIEKRRDDRELAFEALRITRFRE